MSDLLLNVALFVPLGLGLALGGRRVRDVIPAALTVTITVELLQWVVIPGRDATMADVVANTMGGALGGWLGGHWPGLLFPGRRARWVALAWAAWGAALFILTAWSLTPSLPATTWYGQWAPEGDEPEWFTGRVLSAELGRAPLPHHRLPDSDVRRGELRGDTLRLAAAILSGPVTSEPLRILAVADSAGRLVTLSQSGRRLDFSVRTWAADLFLQTPEFRVDAALPATAGDSLWISGRYWRGAAWLQDRRFELSGMAGWSLLLPFAAGSAPALVAGVAWLALIFAPVGWYGGQERSPSWAMAPAIVLLMSSLVIAGYSFTPLPAAWEVAVAAVAVLLGRVLCAVAEPPGV